MRADDWLPDCGHISMAGTLVAPWWWRCQPHDSGTVKELIQGGAITLFVSHSLQQVRKTCNKALWLEKGKQIAFGDVKEICDMYEASSKKK